MKTCNGRRPSTEDDYSWKTTFDDLDSRFPYNGHLVHTIFNTWKTLKGYFWFNWHKFPYQKGVTFFSNPFLQMFMPFIAMILQSKFSKFLVVRALPIAAGTWFRFPAAPLTFLIFKIRVLAIHIIWVLRSL